MQDRKRETADALQNVGGTRPGKDERLLISLLL